MQSELGFPRTDGDSSLWPSNTRRIVDREGQVNYMHPLEIDDPQCIKWREDLGRLVAERIGLPAGPKYFLGSWPEGYKMFVHYKGPQDNPRTDKYLFGSTLVKRFRSVPEFVLHAVWLMMDESLQRSNCGCKYCTRSPQRGISQAAGLSIRSVSSPVARIRQSTQAPLKAPRPPTQREEKEKGGIFEPPSVSVGPAELSPPPSSPLHLRPEEQEQVLLAREVPWFAIRKEPKPVKPSTGPKASVSRGRTTDIDGINSPYRKRLHRIGEVIWCFLDVPIAGPGVEDSAIGAWPGVVKSIQQSMHYTFVIGESTFEHREGSDRPYTYEVSLFNIDAVITVSDERVLPFQAFSSPQPLLDALSSLMHTINRRGDSLHVPAERGLDALSKFTFEEAALPYALAIQTPIMLSKYWSCVESWTFRYTITADKPVATPVVPKKKHRTPGLHIGPMPDLSPSASARLAVLSTEPSAQVKTQKRYQGLWWGGERVWVDDLVRLKVPRHDLAPNGSERVLPTVPASQATIEHAAQKGVEADDAPGSGERALFLRITSIFVAGKEVRISGVLFDLVEDSFVGAGVGGKEGQQEDASVFDMRSLDPVLLQGGNPDASPSQQGSNGFRPASDRQVLSGPYVRSWSPPEPPVGYKFRSILKGDWEAVMDISLMSGRYYPGVLLNPLLVDHMGRLLRLKEPVQHLYALEGLVPGYYNSVDPATPKENRLAMFEDAVAEAKTRCEEWFDKEAVSNLLDAELTSSTSDVEMGEREE